MNKQQLYREIGLVDEDLIQEAEARGKRFSRSLWVKGLAAAACIALGVTGIAWQQGMMQPKKPQEFVYEKKPDAATESAKGNAGEETVSNSAGDEYALILNPASGQISASLAIPGHFWEELTEEETVAICPAAKNIEGYGNLTLTAHYNGDGVPVFVEGTAEKETGGDIYLQIAPGEVVLDCVFVTDTQEVSEINGVSVVAGCFDDTTDGKAVYFAEFMIEDIGYYLKLTGGKAEMALLPALIDEIICGGKADFSALHPQIPEWREDSLTLEEAYQDEEFGKWMPKEIPEGFGFEEARRVYYEGTHERTETNYLSVCWFKGMEEISWDVSYLTEEERTRITAVSDTANYDLSLYPIPMAESVPEELWEIVENPIFEIGDLTEEAVWARAYQIEEQGDTDGYRMRFSVLYPGDVLVGISVKGVDPERVYQMLAQLGE